MAGSKGIRRAVWIVMGDARGEEVGDAIEENGSGIGGVKGVGRVG